MDRRALILGAIAVLGVLAALGYFRWREEQGHAARATPAAAGAVQRSQAPVIRHPIPETAGSPGAAEPPLPPLAESDTEVQRALEQLVGAGAVQQFLIPDGIVRRVVATVDNLPRRELAVRLRPVMPAPGSFVAGGTESSPILDPQNFARYAPAVQLIESLDAQALAALYFRLYPLFQQAYEELGYPDRYFNDRVVEAIDDLLAAPEIETTIALVRPHVLYEFADRALESRSAGQKLLLRMGPQNARTIKAKLRELRGELTRGAP